MRFLLVMLVLPLIYVAAWLVSPLLIALYSVVKVAEQIRANFGGVAAGIFQVGLITLVALAVQSRRWFWFGLLPVTVLTCLVART